MKTYFAYGSNMNIGQMMRRCPTAKLIGTGVLHDYELTFRGGRCGAVATIEPSEGAEVPIVIWRVLKADEAALDIYEGFPRHYFKQDLSVQCNNREVSGFAYIMSDGYEFGLPSGGYFDTILDGYTANELDTKPLFNALYAVKALVG